LVGRRLFGLFGRPENAHYRHTFSFSIPVPVSLCLVTCGAIYHFGNRHRPANFSPGLLPLSDFLPFLVVYNSESLVRFSIRLISTPPTFPIALPPPLPLLDLSVGVCFRWGLLAVFLTCLPSPRANSLSCFFPRFGLVLALQFIVSLFSLFVYIAVHIKVIATFRMITPVSWRTLLLFLPVVLPWILSLGSFAGAPPFFPASLSQSHNFFFPPSLRV